MMNEEATSERATKRKAGCEGWVNRALVVFNVLALGVTVFCTSFLQAFLGGTYGDPATSEYRPQNAFGRMLFEADPEAVNVWIPLLVLTALLAKELIPDTKIVLALNIAFVFGGMVYWAFAAGAFVDLLTLWSSV